MAIKRLEDIREEAVFGRKLFKLGRDVGILGPAAIAGALYKNDECYNLVSPGNRKKYESNKTKDINSIARRVQDHINLENGYDVQGNYMLAYSTLFNCSLDYLYGKIEVKSPDATIADISEKTGLSATAITKLMKKDEVCIEEYLETLNKYGLLETMPADGWDEEDDGGYYESYFSVSKFWSDLIESKLFSELPEDWYRMACAKYTHDGIKVVEEEAKRTWDELPTWEVFSSWVSTWESFHEDRPIHMIYGKTLKEAYDTEPEWVKQVYREIRYEHLYSSVDKVDETETIYWGCAGKLDRTIQNYFHSLADKWCKEGPLPYYGE